MDETRKIQANSLKNLRPQKAGEPSHNPKGRPKKFDCLVECIKAELAKKSLNGIQTKEQIIASALVSMAERGNLRAIELVLEYTAVKPKAELDVNTTGGMTIKVVYEQNNVHINGAQSPEKPVIDVLGTK